MNKISRFMAKALGIIAPIAILVGGSLLFAFILTLLWNAVMPLFLLPVLTMGQMWAAMVVVGSIGVVIEIAKMTFHTISTAMLSGMAVAIAKRVAKTPGNIMEHFPFTNLGSEEDES